MITRSLDVMLSKPGIYIVASRGGFLLVEVVPGGECHQLTLDDFERDGVLDPNGWSPEKVSNIVGPFARLP